MRKYFDVALIALTLSLTLFAIPARAQSALGKIEGQITNGTKDSKASSVQNISVRLFGVAASMSQPFSATVQSDASGKFSFSSLNADPGTKYLLTAQYDGVDYFSNALAFGASQTTLPATITVYETTTDRSVLTVNLTHLIFDIQRGVFNVIQIIAVQNTSDRTLVRGTKAATLPLPILRGAQNIQFQQQEEDETTLRGDGVLTYTLPFFPGSDQIVYNYTLPFTPPNFQFNLKLPYDSAIVRVLVADVGETISSAQFAPSAPFQAQNGQKFLLNIAPNVRAGTTLNATFSNLSATASSSAPSATRAANQNEPLIATAVVAVAALFSLALLVYPIARRRDRSF